MTRINSARFVFLAGLALFFASCQQENVKEIAEFEEMRGGPMEIGEDVELLYSDSAYVKAKVITPEMERYVNENKSYLEMPKGVKAYFYDHDLNIISSIKADYGIRYLNEEKTELKDNVVVVNTDGDSLRTEHLIWEEGKDKVYSDKFVKVRTKDEIINAEGFESDLSFTNYKFYDIKGIITLEHGEPQSNEEKD